MDNHEGNPQPKQPEKIIGTGELRHVLPEVKRAGDPTPAQLLAAHARINSFRENPDAAISSRVNVSDEQLGDARFMELYVTEESTLFEELRDVVGDDEAALLRLTPTVARRTLELYRTERDIKENTRERFTDVTGIRNKAYYDEVLPKNVDEMLETTNGPLSVARIDLDHLKRYNDTMGHRNTDMLIALVVQVMKGSIREQDILVRAGGDEFVLVMPQTTAAQAAEVSNRIREMVNEWLPGVPNSKPGEVEPTEFASMSIGVSSNERGKTNFATLDTEADNAAYVSKAQGRNKVTIFDPNQQVDKTAIIDR